MNFYTLHLNINERRDIISRCIDKYHTDPAKSYIVECLPNIAIPLLHIPNNGILRAFVSGQFDFHLSHLAINASFEANTLTIDISEDQAIAANTKPLKPEMVNTAPKAINYEDLDDFIEEETIKKNPKKATATTRFIHPSRSQFHNKTLGSIDNAFTIASRVTDNGDVQFIGSINEQSLYEFFNQSDQMIQVVIKLHLNDCEYRHSLTLHLASPKEFLGMALDFGSESSQMAIKKYNTDITIVDARPELNNLFKSIEAYHKVKNIIPRDPAQYYQEEIGTRFYKSIFFLKENMTGDYTDFYNEMYIRDWEQNLKMMVNAESGFTELQESRYQQLPNLKITHRYDQNLDNYNFNISSNGYENAVSLADIKSKVYNSILKVIIESALMKEFSMNLNRAKKIRFILLIPNMYDHFDIIKTQKVLEDIFSDLAATTYKGRLLAWETITISESDASFLGYINKNNVQIDYNKDYIIIDAGKGTTDFSIIRTGKENIFNVQPRYRNGFAGAGNMITYSIFETLLHYLISNSPDIVKAKKYINEVIIALLKGKDLGLKVKFYQQIERLKFNYTENISDSKREWLNAREGDYTFKNIVEKNGDIYTFINLLSQVYTIGDFYGYVEDTCELIATRAVNSLKTIKENTPDFNIGGVLMTGRAFLFKPLSYKMHQLINQKLNITDRQISMLDGNDLKEICMKGVFNNAVRLNAEIIGYPIQVVRKEALTEEKSVESKLNFSPKNWGKSIMNILFKELQSIEDQQSIVSTEAQLNKKHLYQSQILIGSKSYKVTSQNLLDQTDKSSVDIRYTPTGFLVRSLKGDEVKEVYKLQEIFDAEEIGRNMLIASLFPNYVNKQYLYSINYADTKKSPIIPPAPPVSQNTQQSTDNNTKKGPIFF